VRLPGFRPGKAPPAMIVAFSLMRMIEVASALPNTPSKGWWALNHKLPARMSTSQAVAIVTGGSKGIEQFCSDPANNESSIFSDQPVEGLKRRRVEAKEEPLVASTRLPAQVLN
jgi:hypothetical protein